MAGLVEVLVIRASASGDDGDDSDDLLLVDLPFPSWRILLPLVPFS